MNVIVLCSGAGTRFSQGGYSTIKPLVKVCDIPMVMHVINAINKNFAKTKIYLVHQEKDKHHFDTAVEDGSLSGIEKFISLKKLTSGAAESAFLALQDLTEEAMNNSPIIIHDCDLDYNKLYVTGNEYPDVGVASFSSKNPIYSYILRNSDEKITKIIEKKVVSNEAVAGCYYFSSPKLFNKLYLIGRGNEEAGVKAEYYMSHIINNAISSGIKVSNFTLDHYRSFGTPEEIANIKCTI